MRRTNLLALILLLLLCAVSQGSFQFVAWADNRPYDSGNRARFVWMLQQMNHIVGSEPLFHVVPGDYDDTSITEADITNVSLIKTWHRAPGNHDTDDLDWPNSAVDLPEALFLFLNEYKCPAGVHDCSLGRVCPDALDWLEIKCQSATSGYPIFVVGHEPAYPENYHVGDSLDLYPGERDAFWDLLVQYRATYICGHTHYYSTYSSGGATQIDVGNAGNPREPEQTFVVVVVTDTDVTFTTWQGLINKDYDVRESWTVDLATAFNPSPADGATQVAVDTDLEWTAGVGAVSHDVYFGTNTNPDTLVSGKQTEATYDPDPGTIDYETTYYWRIDEFDGQGGLIAIGDVWSFTTFVPELPWSDDFESGSFAAGGWTTSGNASASSKADYSGIYGAEIKGTAWIEKAVSTVGFSNINIKYVCMTKGLDEGEYLYIEWYDGSSWHELEATQNTDWSSQNLTCGAGANDNAAFKVRFRTNASNSAEYAYVDDVEISGTSSEPVHDHDVAVIAITAPASVVAGDTATIEVTVENQGMSDETFDVTLTDTPPQGGTAGVVTDSPQTITLLGPGGSITVSFSWDTTVATLGVHTLDVTAVPVNGETDTADNYLSTTSTVVEAGTTIHVESIEMSLSTRTAGPNEFIKAVATVTILDADGVPVEGATVYGSWSIATSDTDSGLTDINGEVTLESDQVKNPPGGTTFTFTVDDVKKTDCTYDHASNEETTDSIP